MAIICSLKVAIGNRRYCQIKSCFVSLHMKKELGKWLMDIAKYLTTAVLLSSVFNDIKDSWIIYFVVSIAIVLTLLSGLWLVREEKKEGE